MGVVGSAIFNLLVVLPLATCGIYVFRNQQDASEHVAADSTDVRPLRYVLFRRWITLVSVGTIETVRHLTVVSAVRVTAPPSYLRKRG
jgi:cation:H+ antiporter